MYTSGAGPKGQSRNLASEGPLEDFLFRYISHRTLMPRCLLIWDLDSSLIGDASLPTENRFVLTLWRMKIQIIFIYAEVCGNLKFLLVFRVSFYVTV